MADKAIQFKDVRVFRNDKPILDRLTFDVNFGETIVFIGRSGSGKTTALKLVNRLLEPTSGEIFVENRGSGDWDPIKLRRQIGYVIQEIGLFPHMTVSENISVVPRLLNDPKEKIEARTAELLNLIGLDPAIFASRFPDSLSGGQRQRVGLARALAADPPIVLLDEPFGALDPIIRKELQKEFLRLAKALHKTMLFVTHDIDEAFLLATRIALFFEGKLAIIGTPDEILKSDHPEARRFVESKMRMP